MVQTSSFDVKRGGIIKSGGGIQKKFGNFESPPPARAEGEFTPNLEERGGGLTDSMAFSESRGGLVILSPPPRSTGGGFHLCSTFDNTFNVIVYFTMYYATSQLLVFKGK